MMVLDHQEPDSLVAYTEYLFQTQLAVIKVEIKKVNQAPLPITNFSITSSLSDMVLLLVCIYHCL